MIHIPVTLLCTLRRTRRKALAFLSPSAEQTALTSHVPVAFQSQLPVTLTLFNKTKGSGGAVCFFSTLQPFINFYFNTTNSYQTLILNQALQEHESF